MMSTARHHPHTMPSSVPEFMRFSAPDPAALASSIADARVRLATALQAGDKLGIVDAAADLGGLLTTARQEAEAVSLLREHAALAETLAHEEAAAWYWNACATALQYCGHRDEADAYFAKALDLCAASGWSRLHPMVLHHWGRSLAERGRFDEAQARIAEALSLRVQTNDPLQASSRRALDVLAQWREAAAPRVAFESPQQPDVMALIAELDAYQDTLYPPESRHVVDVGALAQPHVLFAVARDAAGQALGCAAVVLEADGAGELKRVFVRPVARGQRVAQRLLQLLEATARDRGCRVLRLESGPSQPEALGLYARCGYARRGPFGGYADDPLSVFMEKAI
jgi:putative acetyltransferase